MIRSIRRVRGAICVTAGAGVLTACSGGDGGTTPPVVQPPPDGTGAVVTVGFGSTVSTAARAQVASIVGAGDSIGGAGRLYTSAASRNAGPTAVLALNARGEAILGGMARTDADVSLDATTTAHLLLRLVMPPSLSAKLDQSTLEGAVAGLPTFVALRDSLEATSARGDSYAGAGNVAAAGAVVQSLLATLPAARTAPVGTSDAGRVRVQAAQADTAPFPIALTLAASSTTAGGQLVVTSSAWIPLVVSSGSGADVAVPRRDVCPFCSTPVTTAAPVTRTIAVPADGAVTLSVGFGQSGREEAVRQGALDLVATQVRIATGAALNAETLGARALALAGVTTERIAASAALPTWDAAAASTIGTVRASAPAIAAGLPELVPGYIARPGVATLLRETNVPFQALATQSWSSDRYPYYAQLSTYWTRTTESRRGCVERGVLYAVCVAKVVITPAATAVDAGQAQVLTATMYDSAGNVLTNRPVRWSIDSTNRTFLALGATSGNSITVSGVNLGGPVAVTAEAGVAVKGFASVAVEQDLTGYTLEIKNYHPNPDSMTTRVTLLPGQAYAAPMWAQQRYVVKYNGVSVTGPGSATSIETLACCTSGLKPGPDDVRVANYRIGANNSRTSRPLYFPLDLTLSNTGYRTVIGKTLTVRRADVPTSFTSIVLNADGTCTAAANSPSFPPVGVACTYSFQISADETFQPGCLVSGEVFRKRIAATVRLGVGISSFPTNFMYVFDDGTLGFNANLTCETAGSQRWFITVN